MLVPFATKLATDGLLSTVTIDLTLRCINSITASTNGIFGLISNINTSVQKTDIGAFILKSDIEHKVKQIHVLLSELDVEKIHTNSLGFAISGLNDSILKIEDILGEVHKRTAYNASTFNKLTFRTYKFDDLIEQLKVLVDIFDGRIELLFKVIEVCSACINACIKPTI